MSSSIRPNDASEDELYREIFRLKRENDELRQKTLQEKERTGTLILIDRYIQLLRAYGCTTPFQSLEGTGIFHVLWMLHELRVRIEANDPAYDDGKVGRWIGFIQRELIIWNITTVQEERDFSRPLFRRHPDNG